MGKRRSRPQQWGDAIAEAQEHIEPLQAALESLNELRSEYEEWRDNLPENLEDSPVAEKLDAVLELDFENLVDEVQERLNEAESVELPLGFGRD